MVDISILICCYKMVWANFELGVPSCTMYFTDFIQPTTSGNSPFQDVRLDPCCALFWPISFHVRRWMWMDFLEKIFRQGLPGWNIDSAVELTSTDIGDFKGMLVPIPFEWPDACEDLGEKGNLGKGLPGPSIWHLKSPTMWAPCSYKVVHKPHEYYS